MSGRPTVVVIAKEPVAGRVKTRCTPPCSPAQAAALATAALAQTLSVIAAVPGVRRVLALAGRPGAWLPPGSRSSARAAPGSANGSTACSPTSAAPALLVGMDTPQLTAALVADGLAGIHQRDRDVVGLAADGGFWAVGLARPFPQLFAPVPMSRGDTGALLLRSIGRAGRSPVHLPTLTDVDDMITTSEVAAAMPGSRFTVVVDAIADDPRVPRRSRRVIDIARELHRLIAADGGFTIELGTGRPARAGISVATDPERCLVFAWPDWDDHSVAHWLCAAAACVVGGPTHVGGSREPHSDQVWLDIVTVVPGRSRTAACLLGRTFRQHCVWDLDRAELVHVGAPS